MMDKLDAIKKARRLRKLLHIRQKQNPTLVEKRKFIRYYLRIKNFSPAQIAELVPHWDKNEIISIAKELSEENKTSTGYYVSLSEPLEKLRM